MQPYIYTKQIKIIQFMDSREAKQKEIRVIPVTTYFSMFKKGPREGLSLSNSRGKKYFRRLQKNHVQPNQITSSFTKKQPYHNYKNENDYGLFQNPKQNPSEVLKRMGEQKNYKNGQRNDHQSSQKKEIKFRNNSIKKYHKYSDKVKSCESLLRVFQSTPMKKSFRKTNQRNSQNKSPSIANETKKYQKTIKFLQKQNQYFEGLYINSQQRIEQLKRQTEDQKRKYERVRKIYQQKITQLSHNKQACQKNLGHIYSYDTHQVDLVPEEVIAQNSLQSSTELLIGTGKNSEYNASKISTLSVNSR